MSKPYKYTVNASLGYSATNSSSSLCSADDSMWTWGVFYSFYELFVWMKMSLFNAQHLQWLPLVLLFGIQTNVTSKMDSVCLDKQKHGLHWLQTGSRAWELAQSLHWLQSVTIPTIPCRKRQWKAACWNYISRWTQFAAQELTWLTLNTQTLKHGLKLPLVPPEAVELQRFLTQCRFNGTQSCAVDSFWLPWFSVVTSH